MATFVSDRLPPFHTMMPDPLKGAVLPVKTALVTAAAPSSTDRPPPELPYAVAALPLNVTLLNEGLPPSTDAPAPR